MAFVLIKFAEYQLRTLEELDKEALWAILVTKRIKTPTMHHRLIHKFDLRKYVDFELRRLEPDHPVTAENILLFLPKRI